MPVPKASSFVSACLVNLTFMLGDLSQLIAAMMASRIPIPPLAFEYQILASFRKIALVLTERPLGVIIPIN